MDESLALNALSALAHQTRLALVRLLVDAGADGIAQGEIARALDISASRLAFHLSLLEQAGLVRARRESRNVFYTANLPGIGALLSYVLNDCCKAHPEISRCCRS
jgi:ArsR family transcriptional regulator